MYRLMIVEDERTILEGLANFIEWQSYGFKVVKKLRDGRDAIEYIKYHEVDVILTDIKLINVSGLELAEYVAKNKPTIEVVIISGYKNFQYAKKAVKYGAYDFMSKPVKSKKVSQIFEKLKGKLDKRENNKMRNIRYQEKYREFFPLLKEKFFSDILMGTFSTEEQIIEKLAQLDLEMIADDSYCSLITLQIKDFEKENIDHCYKSIFNFIQDQKNDEMYFFTLRSTLTGYFYLLIIDNDNDNGHSCKLFDKNINNFLDDLKKYAELMLDIELELTSQKGFNSIYELIKLKQSLPDKKHNINKKVEDFMCSKAFGVLQNKKKRIIKYVFNDNFTEIDELINEIFSVLINYNLPFCKNLIIELFSVIANKLEEDMGLELYLVSGGKFDYNKVLKMQDIEQIKNWCLEMFSIIEETIKQHKENYQNNIIARAREYIRKNYNDKDISLEDVASYTGLSAGYFSRLFKNVTRKNFIDYLTKVRIEKARELLVEKENKIYEISHSVGYKNSKYFSQVFKETVGISPSEYRRNKQRK